MINLMGRRTRRAFGPVPVARAHRRKLAPSAVAVLCVALMTFFGASAAMANAPSPTGSPTGTRLTNPDGSVTVAVHGAWLWVFATSHKAGTEGLHATVSDKCDDRFGGGFGIVWNDPHDPGYHETFTEFSFSASVNVGSRGVDPANTESGVTWTKGSPCGTFVQTNKPIPVVRRAHLRQRRFRAGRDLRRDL
jgi:hypothetical protein